MDKIRNLILPFGTQKFLFAAVAALLFTLLDFEFLFLLAFAVTVLFLFAYRNPARLQAAISDYGVVSPVDGRVVEITDIEEDGYGYKVVIDSSLANSGMLRVPFEAKKVSFSLQRGARLAKDSHLFETLNESLEALFENGTRRLKVLHRLKRSPLPIETHFKSKSLECCELYGFAYNAHTTLYLPREFRLNIHVGQSLLSSQNIIGYFSN